ncbi:DUF3999 family protein [Dyella silvatica]|uniref:DUF3999 family protein n=1 Tax=Dyella silvatica TaxID=2992128 RepID=UPI002257DB13|nr:DUF3999 family protein [Dyella silvatica]
MRFDFRCLIPVALLTVALGAHAAADNEYAYAYPLQTQAKGEAYRLVLTPSVYAHVLGSAELRDLVVVNALGREVSFAPMPEAPPQVHPYELKTRLLPVPGGSDAAAGVRVQRNSNGDIVIEQPPANVAKSQPMQWLIDARKAVAINHIELLLPETLGDMRLSVEVKASNDLQTWSELSDSTTLTRSARGDDAVDQRTIAIEGGPARYYRLTLLDGKAPWSVGQEPEVTLTGSFSDAAAERYASLQWLPLQAAVTVKSAAGGTDYDYRLPGALPVEAVRAVMAEANTAARFSVSANSGDNASWSPLGTLTAVRVQSDAAGGDVARFDTHRATTLRLHTDTPLSQSPSLQVGWHPDTFVFLAEGPAPYRLLAGSYAARRADYPVDAVLQRLRATQSDDWQPPAASLGEPVDAAGIAALNAPKVPYDWTRPLLWVVLVAGAAMVAAMAFSLLRRGSKGDGSKEDTTAP